MSQIISTFYLSIYKFGLSVCLSVRLYPINVKTGGPTLPKFVGGQQLTQGKVYRWSHFQKFASNKVRFSLNLKNPWINENRKICKNVYITRKLGVKALCKFSNKIQIFQMQNPPGARSSPTPSTIHRFVEYQKQTDVVYQVLRFWFL